MSQVFANTIDNNPIYAARAEADEDGLNLKQYYAKIADLAAVAFSGSYNDLANTPSIPTKTSDLTNDSGFITASDIPAIPTKTSDLTNDSGFITASDIPAQVNADWNESDPSDPAYIENKPTIPAAQVNSDWNAASGVAQILNKPDMSLYALISSLSTVATSGSYLDLTDLPIIPTKTSDLTNDSGFITASDIPAQVNADWNESDPNDPAYIENKPSIPTATSDLTNDSGFITLSDVPPQVQADWNESDTSDPSYIQNKPTIPVVPTTDQTYDATSSNPQSGTAVAGAIATVKQVPASASGDTGKVLTVDSTGNPAWEAAPTFTQEQADWNETDTTDPAYIKNKPTIPTVPVQDVEYNGTSVVNAQGVAEIPAPSYPVTDVTMDGTSVLNNGVAALTSEVEILAYGSTGAWAKFTAAISAGKSVFCRVNPSGNNYRFVALSYYNINEGTAEFNFHRANPTKNYTTQNDELYVYSISSSGTWATTTRSVGIKSLAGVGLDKTVVNNDSITFFVKPKTNGGIGADSNGVYVESPLPASAAADEGKVLTVNSSGNPEWQTGGGGGTVDQTYDPTSSNAQSGTAVAGALAAVNQVPASTSADEGKVLTVDANGDPEWATGGGGGTQQQADWTQTDSSAVDYIKNKPSLATVATSGSYNDLSNKPSLATVATSGSYNDLSNKPTIPSAGEPLWNYTAKSVSITGSGSSHRFVINDNEPKCYYTSSTGYTHDSTYTDINIRENANAMKHDWTFRFTTALKHFVTVNIYDSNNSLSSRYIIHGSGNGTNRTVISAGGSVTVLNGSASSSTSANVFVEKHGNVIHVYAS